MTLFEFILVMVSPVPAIAVTRLLQGVAAIMHRREDVEADWVPVSWAICLFVLAAANWCPRRLVPSSDGLSDEGNRPAPD